MPDYPLETYDRGELTVKATPLDPRWNPEVGVDFRVTQGSFSVAKTMPVAEVVALAAHLVEQAQAATEKFEADKPRREQAEAEKKIEALQRELDALKPKDACDLCGEDLTNEDKCPTAGCPRDQT